MDTERCQLSVISENDYEQIKKLYLNEQVRKYLGGTVNEESYKVRFQSMLDSENRSLHWSVFLKESNEFIGLVFLDTYHDGTSTEIGYQLLPEFWGKGYAREVIEHVLDYGFHTLGLTTIVAETQTLNLASCGLLQRVGMKLEETLERFGNQQSKYSLSVSELIKN
jgi:[ribosomal protein S5]-alanine N-acetyltransferase